MRYSLLHLSGYDWPLSKLGNFRQLHCKTPGHRVFSCTAGGKTTTEAFDKPKVGYRESVLPKVVTARLAIEADIADYWYQYTELHSAIIGMTRFGGSCPGQRTVQAVCFYRG